MLTVREVIVVEGRYDANTLHQAVDATVIETGGFGVFRDAEKRRYLAMLAEKRGLIILTDSDGAGFVIRNFLKGCVEPKYIKNAYIPDVFGKEKRKSSPSKEGKLGVEGMTKEIIIDCLKKAGATFADGAAQENKTPMTKAELFAMGICGAEGSAEKRKILQKKLGLPERLTSNGLLQALNIITTREELLALLKESERGQN